MDRAAVLTALEQHVRRSLEGRDGSHDWAHIERVRAVAVHIAEQEELSEEQKYVVELAALLHDVADWKYADVDGKQHADGRAAAQALLTPLGVDAAMIQHVGYIITRIGFKEELPTSSGTGQVQELSMEARVVQDADRLDAIGAIGIARCFTFGGRFNRLLYDPSVPPRSSAALTREAYMHEGDDRTRSTTINHFHEKLLTLKDRMKTKTGRSLAEGRHAFMVEFLEQFSREVAGQA